MCVPARGPDAAIFALSERTAVQNSSDHKPPAAAGRYLRYTGACRSCSGPCTSKEGCRSQDHPADTKGSPQARDQVRTGHRIPCSRSRDASSCSCRDARSGSRYRSSTRYSGEGASARQSPCAQTRKAGSGNGKAHASSCALGREDPCHPACAASRSDTRYSTGSGSSSNTRSSRHPGHEAGRPRKTPARHA